jgi:hypothetical protein
LPNLCRVCLGGRYSRNDAASRTRSGELNGGRAAPEKLAALTTTTQIVGPKMAIAGTRIGKATRCAFRLDAASIPSDPGASLLASRAIKAPRCREHGLSFCAFPRGSCDTRGTEAVTTGRVCWRREASGGTQCAYSPWVTQPVCSSHVRVVENLRCGRTQAGEVWAANEAHAVHRNNDPGLVWHWAAADSRWWLLRYSVAGWIPPRRRTDSLRWFIWGELSPAVSLGACVQRSSVVCCSHPV